MATTKGNWIPKMTEKHIVKLSERIKPVVDFGKKGKYYILPVDPFQAVYTHDPKPTDKATGLKHLCDITTYHTPNIFGLFWPSIAEVLIQIPNVFLKRVVAFEIVNDPELTSDVCRHETIGGYLEAKTRLYVRE